MLLGLLLNKGVVEQILSVPMPIQSSAARAVVFTVQVVLVLAGMLLVPRQSLRLPLKAAIVTGSVALCVLANVVLVQLFAHVPLIHSGWNSLWPAGEVNQLGLRGAPITYQAGDFITVLLGDSQVEAVGGSLAEMPASRLEHHLQSQNRRARVFSLGAGGYGQDQQLLKLRQYLQHHRADLVIVWETETNDIWNNLFPTHWPRNATPKPTFWLEADTLRGPSEEHGQALFSHPLKLVAMWQRAATVRELKTRDDKWEASQLPPPWQPESNVQSGDLTWERMRNENRLVGEHPESEKSHLAIGLTPASERMKYGIKLARRLLAEMERLTTAQGGRFMVIQVKVPPGHPISALDTTLMYRTAYTPGHPAPPVQTYLWKGRCYRVSVEQAEQNWNAVNQGFETQIIRLSLSDWPLNDADSHLGPKANDAAMRELARRLADTMPVTP
jgi:hypothetical protein